MGEASIDAGPGTQEERDSQSTTEKPEADLLRLHIPVSAARPVMLGVEGVSGRNRHTRQNGMNVICMKMRTRHGSTALKSQHP